MVKQFEEDTVVCAEHGDVPGVIKKHAQGILIKDIQEEYVRWLPDERIEEFRSTVVGCGKGNCFESMRSGRVRQARKGQWRCGDCKKIYDTEEQAQDCEAVC